MIIDALHAKLSADSTLTALLATFNSEPAIFTVDPAPDEADMPRIIIGPILDQPPFDTKTTRGWSPRCDIRCYTDATGSSQTVDTIAERVRTLLHRTALSISGYTWLWSICTGPIHADETDAYGRIVTVQVTAEKN